jgi:LmbE family N-acetylglucosaminyl deacetylase
MPKEVILAIGAHPDDVELGAFGTLKRHSDEGCSIVIGVLTDGPLGGDPATRRKEAQAAAKLVGAKVEFLHMREGYVRDDYKAVDQIERLVKKHAPTTAYIPCHKDRHQDHRYGSFASISATRFVSNVFMYESASVLENFSPQHFVDITDSFSTKLRAIEAHESQRSRLYMQEGAIRGLATYRGFQASMHGRLAEAFEVVRIVRR